MRILKGVAESQTIQRYSNTYDLLSDKDFFRRSHKTCWCSQSVNAAIVSLYLDLPSAMYALGSSPPGALPSRCQRSGGLRSAVRPLPRPSALRSGPSVAANEQWCASRRASAQNARVSNQLSLSDDILSSTQFKLCRLPTMSVQCQIMLMLPAYPASAFSFVQDGQMI